LATIQTQIQALLAAIGEEVIERSNIGFNIEVTKYLVEKQRRLEGLL